MQLDPRDNPDAVYKLLIGCVVPRPIAWVSTVDADGVNNLAPFSFFMGVCNDPPHIAFSSGPRTGARKDTVRNLVHTGDFVVTTPCFIASDGPALLGAVALESLFLAVDSVAKRLIPVEGFVGAAP